MCSVSVVSQYWQDQLPNQPYWQHLPGTINPGLGGLVPPPITRFEFEQLRNDVNELKELLKAAKKFDDATGQPDCEMEEKVAVIKAIAEMVGVDLSEIFGK